jgi:hypothetical protein
MNTLFWQILRQLFIWINRLSLIEKVLYSFLLVVLTNAVFSSISNIFKILTKYIYDNYPIILAICIGILLFVVGCFLYFTRRETAKNLLHEGVDDEDLDDKYLLEGNPESQSQSIYTEGNYNENVYGDYLEIHGNQININNDFAAVAVQIQELVNQLKNQGYSKEEAEEEIAKKLEEKSSNNPKVKRTLRRWRASFSNKSNAASDKEIAKDVVKTATSYSYTSSKDFTDIVGGDFHVLNELLQSKKWEEADWATMKIIYTISQNELPNYHWYKKYPPNYIVEEHIKVIPKKYLNNIDKLWNKYSNGRFGFRVQKEIWERLYKQEEIYYSYQCNTIKKFGDLVGWRKKGDWLYYVDLYESVKTSAPGHLPLAYMLRSEDKLDKCSVNFDILGVIIERL